MARNAGDRLKDDVALRQLHKEDSQVAGSVSDHTGEE